MEDINHVLAEVETMVERFLGSFGSREYDTVMSAKLPNGGGVLITFLSKWDALLELTGFPRIF
jgi:hypothetical protein